MPSPIKSIRWRFVLWLAFLLTIVLAGFGTTAYQLHRNNQFAQMDEDLKSRTAVLSAVLRTPPSQFKHGPSGFGPSDRMELSHGDRERFRREVFGNRGRSGTNDSWPPDRPFEEGPPRRFSRDDESPGRPGELGAVSDYLLRKIKESSEIARLFDESATNDFYHAVWIRAFGFKADSQSTNAPANVPLPTRNGTDTGTHTRTRENFREAWHYTEMGDCVLVGKSVLADLQATQRFALWLVFGGLAVLLLGVAGIWLLAGHALKPVHNISTAATRISAGNLTERINVSTTDDELGQLATTLNSTFARLETAFTQQQQFTADASHELRTPLAVIISEAQTTLARPRTEREYRETVEACLATAQQMRQLTESLLQLARFDAGQETPQRESLDLAEIARAALTQLHPLADAHALKINTELKSATIRGDRDLLLRVATNLISNAIQYNTQAGTIHIATQTGDSDGQLTVTNTGPGIATEDLPHIFERFYRADKARSRTSGHSGLGLAICQAIVATHGGRLTVTSEPGKITRFTVSLPAST